MERQGYPVPEKNGKKVPGRQAPCTDRETKEKGITQENWLDYLDNVTDSEITAMLNREPLRGSFQ